MQKYILFHLSAKQAMLIHLTSSEM